MSHSTDTLAGKQPRIALVVPALALGGGVPTVAAFLYEVLRRSGEFEVEVISLATSSRDPDSVRLLDPRTWLRGVRVSEGIWQGIPFRHVGALLVEMEFNRYLPRTPLTEMLREFDLVQVVAGTPATALAAREAGRPICLQVATLIHVERVTVLRQARGLAKLRTLLMTLVTIWLDRQALHVPDCVFVENQWMLDALKDRLPPRRLVYAPPGLDAEFFRQETYAEEGYLLCVGRLSDPRKNVRLLFDAYSRLCATNPALPRLALVGSPPLEEDWAYAKHLGIGDRIDMHTHVSQEELVRLYQGASLYIQSSDEEGRGMAILEAMSCGVPVVATRCGGPDVIVTGEDLGILTPLGDAEALSASIQTLLTDPARRTRMSTAVRRYIEDCCSLAAAGKPFLDCYKELLAGNCHVGNNVQ